MNGILRAIIRSSFPLRALVVAFVVLPLSIIQGPAATAPASAHHHIVSWYPGGHNNGCGDEWCYPCRDLCYCCGCPAPGECDEDPT